MCSMISVFLLDCGGLKYSSLTSTATSDKTGSQANDEHNKGEYSLWSDSSSFSKFFDSTIDSIIIYFNTLNIKTHDS